MDKGLYKTSDGVIILTDENFKNGKFSTGFKGQGVLKAYAPWCPHCVDKVKDFKALAKALKDEKTGLYVYVIDADNNRKFSAMENITGFPTILFVNKDATIRKLVDENNQSIHNVPDIIKSICRDHKALC